MKNKELFIAIVKGNVANYAKSTAQLNNLTAEELATILREIADLLANKE